jgi:hypothetical protein
LSGVGTPKTGLFGAPGATWEACIAELGKGDRVPRSA